MLVGGLQDVGHEDVATRCGAFSLRSLISRLSFLSNPASTARSSGHKHDLCGRKERLPPSPCLMLLAGLQEVGHEDVATGRGVFSLCSLKQSLQLFM